MNKNFLLSKKEIEEIFKNYYKNYNILNFEKYKNSKNLYDIRKINTYIKEKNNNYNFSKINNFNFKNNKKIDFKKYKVLDLFSGAGGFSKGFEMAGFEILGSIDNNKVFCNTHKINFPNSLTVCDDISKTEVISKFKNLKKDIDVIIGSPPCQTFSNAGTGRIKSLKKDITKDLRNYYYKSYIDYVLYFKPKIFILENVPGFKTKFNGKIFNDFINYFNSNLKPKYYLNFKILNSINFGVPQNRKRIFIIGSLDPNFLDLPDGNNLFKDNTTVNDAISDLPFINDDWRIDRMPYSKNKNLTTYQKFMRKNKKDFISNNICRVSNEKAKQVFEKLEPNQKYKDLSTTLKNKINFFENFNSKILINRMRKLPVDEPSWTIIAHIGMDGYEYIHPFENRTLSVREAARLQSFPDEYIFTGNMREQYVQIGNAVSPLVAYKIGLDILKNLKYKKFNG